MITLCIAWLDCVWNKQYEVLYLGAIALDAVCIEETFSFVTKLCLC